MSIPWWVPCSRYLLRHSVVHMLWGLCILWSAVAAYTTPAAPQERIASAVLAAVQTLRTPPLSAETAMQQGRRLSQEGMLRVYIYSRALQAEHLTILQQHGVRVLQSHAQIGIVYALVPVAALERVAMEPFVEWIAPPVDATRRQGSVTSEGDTALRADQARATFSVTGQGVRIGIISDSLTDVPAAIAQGDLPAAGVTIVNGHDGTTDPDSINEGRALAEVIHDLAPGAALFFHSGFPTSLDMVAAIEALTAAGVHIIIDDLLFLAEPVFEDGAIAQAVQNAMAQGVIVVTAAGNSADQHYLAPYSGVPSGRGEVHNFGGGDTALDIRISGNIGVFLQWPNPANGAANTADYDMFLTDSTDSTLASSIDRQIGGNAPPREALFFSIPPGARQTVRVVIKRVAGENLPVSLYFVGTVALLEHYVSTSSLFGHACVRGALSVGAVNVAFPDTLEAFSSHGPCPILLPQRDVRTKPDVIASDGVMTSLPMFSPFFGTSPSAAHVAAVAALMLEAAGGPGTASSTQITNTLRVTARDGGILGVDNSFGHGVIDALQAVAAARALQAGSQTPPQSVIDDPPEDVFIPLNVLFPLQGACIDAEDQQPFTALWDFGGARPPLTTVHPGAVIFPTVGTFTMTFTCTDAAGLSDPTPATRQITVNAPPDSTITAPASDVTITAGDSVAFVGTCADLEGDTPIMLLWNFAGGATIPTSTQANPLVFFNQIGTFTVTLTCTDARNFADPTPASVRVTVQAARRSGGGGCTLLPPEQRASAHPLDALSTVWLPVAVLGMVWVWSRKKRRCYPGGHCQKVWKLWATCVRIYKGTKCLDHNNRAGCGGNEEIHGYLDH